MIKTIAELKKEVKSVLAEIGVNVYSIRKAKKGDGVFIYKNKGDMGLFIGFESANYKDEFIDMKKYIQAGL